MKRILWTGLVLIALMTFVFGISLAENAGGDGTWTAAVEGDVLILSGSGAIPGLEDPTEASWAESLDTIRQVFIEDGITAIGKNVLAGFADPELRIDFRMSEMPQIDPEAFSGTTAVCRYYSDNESWTGGNFGGNLTWIWLPEDIEGETGGMLVYHADSGWNVQVDGEFGQRHISATAAQGAEMLWKGHWVTLFDMPEREEDWAVVEDFRSTYFVSFQEGCVGTRTFTIGADGRGDIGMDIYAPGLVLEVNAAEEQLGTISVGGGQVTVNGDVYCIVADGFQTPREGNYPSVTVNGNVEVLNFYDETSDRGFTGDLYISGTVTKGTEYGSGTLSIPHISDSVKLDSINTASFANIQQQDPIILNGQLNVPDVQPLENLTIDMFRLNYSYFGKGFEDKDDWRLSLSPRPEYPELGDYGAYFENIVEYNPDFTVDDIVWGDYTSLSFWKMHDEEPVILNGQTDENGNLIGLASCSARDVNLVINCPVQDLSVDRYFADGESPVTCTINGPVDYCWIDVCGSGNHVSLGENGRIREGVWNRGIRGFRYFGPVSGTAEVYAGETLQVLNWKDGENIRAILPADDTVTEAAGLGDGQTASADISESALEALTPEETAAMNDYLAGQESGTPAAVFEATVTAYQVSDSGEWTENGAVTSLNQEIPFTVSNESGGEAYILRLHESPDGTVSADQLCEATDAGTLTFESDLFSKYVILTAGEPVDIVASGACGDNLTWTLDSNGLLTISGEGGMDNFDPDRAPWSSYTGSVQSVLIGAGVTGLADCPFYSCYRLKSISVDENNSCFTSVNGIVYDKNMQTLVAFPTGVSGEFAIPDGITEVGDFAFFGCRLGGITVPDGVTRIGRRAFMNCSDLESATLPDSVVYMGDDLFAGCSRLKSAPIPPHAEYLGKDMFFDCYDLHSVTIPDGLSAISEGMFTNCSGITSVIIPESVTYIGPSAFWDTSLTDVYYAGSQEQWEAIEIITDGGPVNTNGPLFSATIHYNSTEINNSGPCGENATWSLDDNGVLTIAGTGEMYDYSSSSARTWKNAETVVIEDGITRIGDYAFYDCELSDITIPDSVTSIGSYAFSRSSVWNITIPNSVTSIGDGAFESCVQLGGITIPESVTHMGAQTFSGSYNLQNILVHEDNPCFDSLDGVLFDEGYLTLLAFPGGRSGEYSIPEGVTGIGDYAFANCESLTGIAIPDTVTSIGADAFYWCNQLTSVVLPDGVTSIGDEAFYCSGVANITLPDSVTSIGDSAFRNSGLTNITIPNGVTRIADYTFAECWSLTAVVIPGHVTSIGDHAFYGCQNLTDVTISNGVTSIDESAFNSCESLTDITIPDGVTTIAPYTFFNCKKLESITIPVSVTSIGRRAFSYQFSSSSLTDVYYGGTQEQWNEVAIGEDNEPLINATIHVKEPGDEPKALTPGIPEVVVFDDSVKDALFSFVPEETGTYRLFSPADPGHYGIEGLLYDRNMNEIGSFYQPAVFMDFEFFCDLIEGTQYFFKVSFGDEMSGASGTFTFTVTLDRFQGLKTAKMATDYYSVPCNETVTFQVTADYTEGTELTYQWYRSDDDYVLLEGETSPSLTVAVTRTQSYFCRVSDQYERTLEAWGFTAVENHLEANIDEERTVKANEPFRMEVEASCDTGEISYQWNIIEEREVHEGVDTWTELNIEPIEGATGAFCTTAVTEPTVFECDITDVFGNMLWVTFRVDCEGEAVILNLPENLTAIESEAFANLESVDAVRIPGSVTSIADDAFDEDMPIIAPVGSPAIEWAAEHDRICIGE